MITHWTIFLLASLAIIIAGTKLAAYGEIIGYHTGIGQGWIGLIFLATITSIPELTTTITGATIGAPNISFGNALGSNLFNIAIIAVVDILLLGRGPFLRKVHTYHVASGGMAIILTVLVLIGIILPQPSWPLTVSPISILIIGGYLFGIFLLYRVEKQTGQDEKKLHAGSISLRHAVIGFTVCAAVIITAGVFLIYASKAISIETGMSASLIGAILVAIVTSLPELSTSIGALRIGAYDMIVGNLFGSNMFNILTIAFADIAFTKGSIFAALGAEKADQLLVGTLGIGITAAAVVGISARSTRRVLGMGVDAALLLACYLASTYLIIAQGIHL